MPVLNWIGKDAVVRHDAEVPFRLLHDVPELACLPSPSGRGAGGEGSDPAQNSTDNLIVEGDNLLALKALLPHYSGQVKCIYIDPPYNTGNEGWVYNDNVNSPQMREWLGKVVGKEAEDLTRHDKWLCMMYPRLVLLKKFLREDGVIFVSIDDNEVAALRILLDEIFGARNFAATFIWEKRTTRENRRIFSFSHDYVLCYALDVEKFESVRGELPLSAEVRARHRNPDNDARGPWQSVAITAQAGHGTPDQFYVITTPSGREVDLPHGNCWRFTKRKLDELIADGRIYFGPRGANVPRQKKFLSEANRGLTPHTLWKSDEVGTTDTATKALIDILQSDATFETPKASGLIQRILQIASDKDSLILDSFAGSGTTAHAVLKQNAEDGGNRRCILVEMDPDIARNVTAERVKRVAQGYTNAKGESVAGLGGGFRFATLGKPLFDAQGHYINPEVRFAELARFVWFMETGVPWQVSPPSGLRPPSPASGGREAKSPLLGIHAGRAVYLLYNGILKDKSTGGGNVLTSPLLNELPRHDGPSTIYGARCLIKPERLRGLRIVFKQLPHDLQVAR